MSLNVRIDLEPEIGPFSPSPGRNKSVTLEVGTKRDCTISWVGLSSPAREQLGRGEHAIYYHDGGLKKTKLSFISRVMSV